MVYRKKQKLSYGMKVLASALSLGITVAGMPVINVNAAGNTGWVEENGVKYWYEDGVKQGTEGRGKEIYDPDSSAWYWLDAIDGGRMAVSKDVYQESLAGAWGDIQGENGETYGKWVRYDENGHMIKGWQTTDEGTYYFDPVYGTMAKGDACIDGQNYYFNEKTGVLESGGQTDDDGNSFSIDGWHKVGGVEYWYESGVRQGYDAVNPDYRGKEIYDPVSNAWYWLDNVQHGAMAKNKDVYQESEAGAWGDIMGEDGKTYGKWVRYDENGHMVKGWQTTEAGTYYFDPVYGTMAKGLATIDDDIYYFDMASGILAKNTSIETEDGKYTFGEDGKAVVTEDDTKDDAEDESDDATEDDKIDEENVHRMVWKKVTFYIGDKISKWVEYEYDASGKEINGIDYLSDGTINGRIEYEYDTNGNLIKEAWYAPDGLIRDLDEYEYDDNGNLVKWEEYWYGFYYAGGGEYEYDANGRNIKYTKYASESGAVSYWEEREYDANGRNVKYTKYNSDGTVNYWSVSEYDANGRNVKYTKYNPDGTVNYWEEGKYDDNGNLIKDTIYTPNGTVSYWFEYEYDANGNKVKYTKHNSNGSVSGWEEWDYDTYGNVVKYKQYNSDGSVNEGYEYEYRYE